MNEMITVFSVEFTRRLKSRPFLIGTAIGVLFIFGTFQFGKLLGNAASGPKRIILAGPPQLVDQARGLLAKDFQIVESLPPLVQKPSVKWLEAHHQAVAAIELRRSGNRLETTAYALDLANFPARRLGADIAPLNLAIATHVPERRIRDLIDMRVHVRSVTDKFASAEAADIAQGIAYSLVFILYISIVMNNQSIMSSVAEEKTSRVAELLVATVNPQWLLGGKILAGVALGLLQLAAWIAAGMLSGQHVFASPAAGAAPLPAAAGAGVLGLPISPGEIALLFVFFVIGYISYAVISAAVASLITRPEDLGTVSFPIVMPIVIAVLLANYALVAPNSNTIIATSFIPLLAPFVMFTRSVVGDVPSWQIALSLAINVASIVIFVWFSAKLYRIGLLLYGRPPKLGQIIAILRS